MSDYKQELETLRNKVKVLNKIGLAFSNETNTNKLLQMILEESLNLTNSDAGSIYMLDSIDKKPVMLFKHFINRSSDIDFKGEAILINDDSLTGYVSNNGQPLVINDLDDPNHDFPFKINKDFDKRSMYKTQNVCTIPMKNDLGEVIGVLQILNKKSDPNITLQKESDFEEFVVPFTEDDIETVFSIASQTAIIVERLTLHQKLERNVSLTRTTLISFFNAMKQAMSQIGEDIMEEQEKFKKFATLDPLTGLMTRQEGISFFKQQLEFARFNGVKVVVSFIDVNDLKVINDTYGHLAGDELLSNIGHIIKDTARQNDTIFRYGGDEFILILYNVNLETAHQVWKRIISNIDEFNKTSPHPFDLSVSYGMSEFDHIQNQSIDELIDLADKQMYANKQRYKRQKKLTE